MIKFFIWLLFVFIIYVWYKKYKFKWYFNYRVINKKYNLVTVEFLYYDKSNIIRKGKLVVQKMDSLDIINILQECFIEKINL